MKKYLIPICLLVFATSCSENSNDSTNGETMPDKSVVVYQTTRATEKLMVKQTTLDFTSDIANLAIRLDSTSQKQEIEGFGAALTGSSAYLLKNMNVEKRAELLKALFSDNGIGLQYLRLAIGSSDFSMGNYTYCDVPDISKFAIPEIDKRDLLPVLKEILALNKDMKLMSTPWTAPAWMKGSKKLYGGSLSGKGVYDDFATYFVKYINAFKNEGIRIDAISLQNEPHLQVDTYPTMYMEWTEQSEIIKNYLAPKLQAAGINTKILIWDHNFDGVEYPINILNDAATRPYVGGVAFHGYGGTPADLDKLIAAYPDESIYFTEQSGGGWNTDDKIGNMLYYMKDMLMPSINRGSRNFLMWNLALDNNHGPVTVSGGGCEDCRGVVTINDNNTYTLNEEYYLLGHFSKFIKKGAHRIAYSLTAAKPQNMEVSAFLNPDGSKVVVVLNQSGVRQPFSVSTGTRRFTYTLTDQAVATFVFK